MSVIRKSQPGITRVVPHQGNRRWAIPNRVGAGSKYQPYTFTKGLDLDLNPSTANWTNSAMFRFEDRAENAIGDQGIRFGDGVGGFMFRSFSTGDLSTYGPDASLAIWLWCTWAQNSANPKVEVRVFNPNLTDGCEILTDTSRGFRQGHNCIKFPPFDVKGTVSGWRPANGTNGVMESWSDIGAGFDPSLGIARIEIGFNGSTVYNNSQVMQFNALTYGYRQPSVVTINYDDGRATLATQLYDDGTFNGNIMQWHNYLGIPFSIGNVYSSGLTTPQLSEAVQLGGEIYTHGDSPPTNVVWDTATNSVIDLSLVQGDSMLYNRNWNTDNGFSDEQSSGYVYPLSTNRLSGQAWMEEQQSVARQYFTFMRSGAPCFQYYDQLPGWTPRLDFNTVGGITPEDTNQIKDWTALVNNAYGGVCKRQGGTLNLFFHSMVAGGTQTTPPGGTDYFIKDLVDFMKIVAADRDAGDVQCETMLSDYGRFVASGVSRKWALEP